SVLRDMSGRLIDAVLHPSITRSLCLVQDAPGSLVGCAASSARRAWRRPCGRGFSPGHDRSDRPFNESSAPAMGSAASRMRQCAAASEPRMIFRWFESLIDLFSDPGDGVPPTGLARFYWHYLRQV